METWRSQCGTYAVVVEARFMDEASRLAREHYPREVGTSLVGRYSDDGWHATVLRVAPLTPDSAGGIAWFRRGMRGLSAYFASLFTETAGLTHYVGEWHSHPNGRPVPSRTDDRNMMGIARDRSARCPECILVLLAIRSSVVEPAVFVYSRQRGRVDLVRDASRL